MTSFANLTVAQLLAALASPDPTPGGGTAAAIAGAMGTSLLAMVSGLAKSKNNLDDEKAAVGRLNRAALEDVVYAPTGFFLSYTAWRKNVSGIAKGPLPFFWDVSKTA